MKKNLVFAGLLFVTGVSQMTAQEKEGNIPEVTIAAKSNQQLHKTGKNVQLITTKDLEKYKGQNLSEILSQASGFQITGNFNNNPGSLGSAGPKAPAPAWGVCPCSGERTDDWKPMNRPPRALLRRSHLVNPPVCGMPPGSPIETDAWKHRQ